MNVVTELDEYSAGYFTGSGSANAVDQEPPTEDAGEVRVKQLRAIVEEITGKPVVATKNRIGFLP